MRNGEFAGDIGKGLSASFVPQTRWRKACYIYCGLFWGRPKQCKVSKHDGRKKTRSDPHLPTPTGKNTTNPTSTYIISCLESPSMHYFKTFSFVTAARAKSTREVVRTLKYERQVSISCAQHAYRIRRLHEWCLPAGREGWFSSGMGIITSAM